MPEGEGRGGNLWNTGMTGRSEEVAREGRNVWVATDNRRWVRLDKVGTLGINSCVLIRGIIRTKV